MGHDSADKTVLAQLAEETVTVAQRRTLLASSVTANEGIVLSGVGGWTSYIIVVGSMSLPECCLHVQSHRLLFAACCLTGDNHISLYIT